MPLAAACHPEALEAQAKKDFHYHPSSASQKKNKLCQQLEIFLSKQNKQRKKSAKFPKSACNKKLLSKASLQILKIFLIIKKTSRPMRLKLQEPKCSQNNFNKTKTSNF
ncbi:hypothetical protein DRF58_17595 [Epilithonimonas hispanica]|uniref:Uncharacterized protein n=1 Tax=Epilithonimonas hispanica TaxID=358687 RepID=A0A3D9CJB8_9FLAO|nr:hypothetical protein DRF58_17595 [Epilithonimonas hispanica]